VAQAYAAVAVIVNLVASLPRAGASLSYRPAQLPGTGHSAHRRRRLSAFGHHGARSLRGHLVLILGQLLGVVLIFVGFLVSEEVFKDLRLVRPAGSASAKGTL